MTEAQEQMLIEIHATVKQFKDLFNEKIVDKEISFSPNPNDTSLCAKKIE